MCQVTRCRSWYTGLPEKWVPGTRLALLVRYQSEQPRFNDLYFGNRASQERFGENLVINIMPSHNEVHFL